MCHAIVVVSKCAYARKQPLGGSQEHATNTASTRSRNDVLIVHWILRTAIKKCSCDTRVRHVDFDIAWVNFIRDTPPSLLTIETVTSMYAIGSAVTVGNNMWRNVALEVNSERASAYQGTGYEWTCKVSLFPLLNLLDICTGEPMYVWNVRIEQTCPMSTVGFFS